MKILPLTLKREYFDEILSGEKDEEYRELKQYWFDRIDSEIDKKTYTHIHFRNGYGPKVPSMLIELKKVTCETLYFPSEKDTATQEYGEEGDFYVLRLGNIIEVAHLLPEQKRLLKQNKRVKL